jgi:hypothetical protein
VKALSLIALISTSAFAQYAVLSPGLQSGDAKKLGAKGWLGLWPQKLAPVQVTFEAARHPIDDDGKPESVKTAIDVKVSAGETEPPLMLLRGLAARELQPLSESNVSLAQVGDVNVGAMSLRTEALGARGHRLVLMSGEVKQTLFEHAESDTEGWLLRWAGDLDGDGKPDFLIDADKHYAQQTTRLLLSSKAKRGQLVREIARRTASGC